MEINTMNIAIVDDVLRERKALLDIIDEYAALNQISLEKYSFESAEAFLEGYKPYFYTIIFLDIYMDGIDGVEAARKVREVDTDATIVFLTSSDEHMPDAFSVHAFDYIGKPAHKERVFGLIDEILERRTSVSNEPSFSFMCDKNQIAIPYSRIALIRTSAANYLEIIDSDGKSHTTRMTFSAVSDELSKDVRFLTVIRGVLVNMDHIIRIEKDTCLTDIDQKIPVNVKKADELSEIFRNYKFKKIRAERRERRTKK